MTPYWEDGWVTLHKGDAVSVLRELPAESVHMCVTSPPYWSLRRYDGEQHVVWGGSPDCDHEWGDRIEWHDERESTVHGKSRTTNRHYGDPSRRFNGNHQKHSAGARCVKCDAYSGPLGLESVHDCLGWATGAACGACYVCHIVEVMRQVWRVLRRDATLWLNLGDSYVNNGHGSRNPERWPGQSRNDNSPAIRHSPPGLKAKDLCMVPARVALALQADGWVLRSRITWCKASAMPESVRDRPSSATEDIYLFSKSDRYFYDQLGYSEPATRGAAGSTFTEGKTGINGNGRVSEKPREEHSHRNLRNFWLLGPEPYPEAHFATFPTEIPRRAVLLGTSERGVCRQCGTPWVRVVERQHWGSRGPERGQEKVVGMTRNKLGGQKFYDTEYVAPVPTGWRPDCTCNGELARERYQSGEHEDENGVKHPLYSTRTIYTPYIPLDEHPVAPAVVLDPFVGSGTTCAVARHYMRRSIGIDLAYQEHQLKRLAQGMLPWEAEE